MQEKIYGSAELIEHYNALGLSVSERTMWEWFSTGYHPGHKIGRRWYATETNIKEFLEKTKFTPPAEKCGDSSNNGSGDA